MAVAQQTLTVPKKKAQVSQPKKKAQVSQSYWSLVWWKFRRNRVALFGGVILAALYFSMGIVPEFVSPYLLERASNYTEAAPQQVHLFDESGAFRGPFVYGLERQIDTVKRTRVFVEDKTKIWPLGLFVQGDSYQLLGFIPTNIHLYGVVSDNIHLYGVVSDDPDAQFFIMGTDARGRDWFTRIIYGGRLSLLIGLLGQLMLLFFGTILGVASGYYGGAVDQVIQRSTEFLGAIPEIPLFMALAAAIPAFWSPIAVYFMLTLILSFVRWGGLARQVRGLILSLPA